MKHYPITPVAKPRMTRSDKWKQRDCVLKYRAYKDEVRLHNVEVPEGGAHIVFVIPMPASWSQKKRAQTAGTPHQQRPDVDNFHKGLLDAALAEDCRVWDHRITKIWGEQGGITIREMGDAA